MAGVGAFSLPPVLLWREVQAVRRWLRTQPADALLCALYTYSMLVYGPLVIRRLARARGLSPADADLLASRCIVPEYGESELTTRRGPHGRGAYLTRSGRWIGPDRIPYGGAVPPNSVCLPGYRSLVSTGVCHYVRACQ